MIKRKKYHVTQQPDGDWQGKLPGAERASVVESTKEKALRETIKLAKRAPLGQVVIHRGDNVIQSERTYGKDPRKYKG